MSANKKTIYIIATAVLIGIAGFFIFKIYFLDGTRQGGATGQSPAEPSTVTISKLVNIPEGESISIGTASGAVIVKNFYKTAVGGVEQFVVIKKNENYEINYDTYTSGFSVYISASPFAMNRQAAENDFLEILGISQTDACKLKVWVGASSEVQPDSGLPRGEALRSLSFCGGIL